MNDFIKQSLQTTEWISEFEHVASILPGPADVTKNDSALSKWDS